MKKSKYVVGIDLGTTHCVLAYTITPSDEDNDPDINVFKIPQITAPGEVNEQSLLPSFMFFPGEHDVPEGSLALPWDTGASFATGEFARKRGARKSQTVLFLQVNHGYVITGLIAKQTYCHGIAHQT